MSTTTTTTTENAASPADINKKNPSVEDVSMESETPIATKESSDVVVTLTSSDGTEIKIQKKVALMSGLIKDMMEDADDDEHDPRIPIVNIEKGQTLKKIVEYMEHHWNNPAEEIEKPLKGKIEDVICDWDKKYLEMDQALLIEVITGSNYMNIKPLLDLTCAKVASMIKGKSPEQIREMFGIENDFTPEEEEKIREENKWCEDA